MVRYFLSKLSVEGFRGINNEQHPLNLKFSSNTVSSLFALNAHGKSSIFEALYYAIHGKIPKLDSLQAQESPGNYYCNLFHSKREAQISLEFQSDDGTEHVSINVGRDGNGNRTVISPSGHPNPKKFLAMLAESFTLLDYKTFARFIEDSPLSRGRTFSSLLGLAHFSDCRQSLQAVSDTRTLNSDLELRTLEITNKSTTMAEEQAVQNLIKNYKNVTGETVDNTENLEDLDLQVTKFLQNTELLKPHIKNCSVSEIDFEKLKSKIQSAEGGKERELLSQTIKSINTLKSLPVPKLSAIQMEQERLRRLLQERKTLLDMTRGDLFKRLYEVATDVIEKGYWSDDDKCPLCESHLQSSIADYLTKQLEQFSEVQKKMVQISDTWYSSKWKVCLETLEACSQIEIDSDQKQSSMLDSNLKRGELSIEDLDSTKTWTATLLETFGNKLDTLRTQKAKLEESLPPSLVRLTEQVEHAQQFSTTLSFLKETRRKRRLEQARLDIRNRWQKFISYASETFSTAETSLAKERIENLEMEYTSMFRKIMECEDVVPNLQRANKKEDVHMLLTDFHGKNSLSAVALLSESYRNALALSVFLSAAMHYSNKTRFVVLDDVSSSFDTGHQFLLFELIRTKLQQPRNPNGLQFIILTHDVALQKYFDRLNSNSDWEHFTLTGTPPRGLVQSQHEDVDRLRRKIESLLAVGEVDLAEPFIRHYLEYKLQQIIRRVNIPVNIEIALKDTKRTVNNCVNAITSAISLHKKAGTLILTQKQIQNFDALHVPAIVSNWGAHWETGSVSNLSPKVLKGVMKYIDDLVDCFRYDDTSNGSNVRRWYAALDRK